MVAFKSGFCLLVVFGSSLFYLLAATDLGCVLAEFSTGSLGWWSPSAWLCFREDWAFLGGVLLMFPFMADGSSSPFTGFLCLERLLNSKLSPAPIWAIWLPDLCTSTVLGTDLGTLGVVLNISASPMIWSARLRNFWWITRQPLEIRVPII